MESLIEDWDAPGCHLGKIRTHLGVIRGDDLGAHRAHQGRTGVQGGPREGHVLQTLCLKVILRHLKKHQDEARNFEEDSRRAQGGLWEGHVLE